MALPRFRPPDPPDGCRDPELWTLLAQFEFVRWMHLVHHELLPDYKRLCGALVGNIERVVAALDESEPLFRMRAAIFTIAQYRQQRVDLILRMLDDPEAYVRAKIAWLMFEIADPRVEGRLVELLLTDPDPEVRGSACQGLAGQNPLSAIPLLIRALDTDHAVDQQLGHAVSWLAASALDEMMGTEFMAKRKGSLCTFPDSPPDPQSVREHAIAFLEQLRREGLD
jgi:HEAT repeats